MKWTSILAIYLLFWVMSAFFVMPFGVKNTDEAGEMLVQGQEAGAPANFDPKRILIRTTILSLILFGIYYINYINGWISF
jgi:predicted secreted protein